MFLPIFWIIFVASLPFFCFCSLHHHRLVSSFLFSCVTFHLFLYPSRHAFCYSSLSCNHQSLNSFLQHHRHFLPFPFHSFPSPLYILYIFLSVSAATLSILHSLLYISKISIVFPFSNLRHVSARKKEGISIGK